MRELIVKLETLKESKEREKITTELEKSVEEQCKQLLDGTVEEEEYTEWDLIRHDISYIKGLQERLGKVKDKETREALIADLDKSIQWRENRLLGKTNEYKLDEYEVMDKGYGLADLYRSENRWIECFKNLPNKIAEELKVKEGQVQEMEEAEVQEQIDALASLEADWL